MDLLNMNNKEAVIVINYFNDVYPQRIAELKVRALYHETINSFIQSLIQAKERLLDQYNHSHRLYKKKIDANDSAQNALRAFHDAWDQVRLCIDQEMSQ